MCNDAKSSTRRILDCAQVIVGQKGFSAVGINEILKAAGVPKGSFYHYYSSKDVFGEALLDDYFESYIKDMDELFSARNLSTREKMTAYWLQWISNQTGDGLPGKCLAVKLGAEVADLSELMRLALERGTSSIIRRLTVAIEHCAEDGTVACVPAPEEVASRLYQLWLGASVMAKITRTSEPLDEALKETNLVLERVVGVQGQDRQ